MLLRELLKGIRIEEIHGSALVDVQQLSLDSRTCTQHSLFCAIIGTAQDGHAFIHAAIMNGAVAVVCERMPEQRSPLVTYVTVKDAAKAIGEIASGFYGHPSRLLKVIGVTGTNGKTTVATLLFELLIHLRYRAGLISTVENRINETSIPSTHTTPDVIELNSLMRRMVDEGCTYCCMEASSHAITQHRISGIQFAMGIFTNITHDHLDYHGTFEKYIKAKKAFFDGLAKNTITLVNADDPYADRVIEGSTVTKRSFGLKNKSDFNCEVLSNGFSGLELNIDGRIIHTKLIGAFNASNIVAVYAAAILMGLDKEVVLRKMPELEPPRGRMQCTQLNNGVIGVIDYAHTPDALSNVLQTLRAIKEPEQRIITVVGCGGDRDKEKRPKMGKIAVEQSDIAIITSDNPRSEDPQEIIRQMMVGIPASDRIFSIIDRKEAIRKACALARSGDIILVAGKGHEPYQEIKGKRIGFDDAQVLRHFLA